MDGQLDSLDLSTNIEFLHFVTEVCDGRVCWVICAEDLYGLLD